MRNLLKLAWRNIWRNRRRTIINIGAAGIGLLLVIVYNGLIAGVVSDGKNQLDNTGMGHVEVSATGWRAKRSVAVTMRDPDALLAQLQLPPGAQVSARVVARGLASSAHGGQGVTIHGVDVPAEALLSNCLADIRKGALLSNDDARGVLVGEKLAERLRVGVGQKLRVMVQRADGEMGADIFRVRGIFHSLAPQVSRGAVVVTTRAAQSLLGTPGAAHQVAIQLEKAADAEGLAAALRAKLGADYEVVTWGQLLPILVTMEGLVDVVMMVLTLFVYLLVGLGILNTMVMSVLERTHEFGVMQAVGNRPGTLVAVVLAESFWIATISVAVGLALGLFVTWMGSERPLMDFSKTMGESFEYGGAVMRTAFLTKFSIADGFRSSLVVYAVTLVVGLYPAWRVSRMRPANALRAA